MQHSTSVLESQVDYLTVAYHGREQTDILADFANGLVAGEAAGGGDVKPWDCYGYVGWRVGRVAYGEREAAGLLQLSGQLAEDHAHDLVPYASTVSRLDLAVTVQLDPPNLFHGTDLYAELVNFYHSTPGSALPWEVADADCGHTVYLGKRTSDVFFRCYNKEAECRADHDRGGQERYQGAWRYELELHDDAARLVAQSTIASRSRWRYVLGYVGGYVAAHGGTTDWQGDVPPQYVRGFRRRSDRDTRLRWFAKQVAPALDRELKRGNQPEVWRALGLKGAPTAE